MTEFVLWALLAFVLIVSPVQAADPLERDVRVTDAFGPVTLKTADHPKQTVILDGETPLAEGDIIETGPLGKAEITVNGETVFTLQAGSHLTFKKIFLRNTQLELSQGAMLAKVKPATQPDESLIIKMPTAVVAIRGTEFGVETGGGVSHVGVFDEGHVVVAGAWGHEHVILAPNQETRVTLSNVPRPPYKLAHFQTYRKQMSHLRYRTAYWQKNWTPLSTQRKQDIRQYLANPKRKPSPTFHHPVQPQRHLTAVHRKLHHKTHPTPTHKKKKPTHPSKLHPKRRKAQSDS